MDEDAPLLPPGGGRKTSRRTAALEIPQYHTISPTMEEFSNFPKLIASLEAKNAHHAGIVKIKPPKEWVPRKIGYKPEDFPFNIKKPIEQAFKMVGKRRGCYQAKSIAKTKKTLPEFHEMATSDKYTAPFHDGDHDKLEKIYWKSLREGKTNVSPWPIYGADVSLSLTDPEVDSFNIAKLNSILNIIAEETGEIYQGVNSPYLYFGMWKATFSWHVEDMDLYAINFLHHGAPKAWYCVPPKYGHLLEKACRELFPDVARWCSNFMRHKTCLVEPRVLEEMGVPYQRVVQEERDIIVVFPYAYHSGFNHGWNIAESTNFAFERWVEYGKYYGPCDCSLRGVKINMDPFVKKYQPERYELWKKGKDINPHPEDPPEKREAIKQRKNNPQAYAEKIREERLMQEEVLRKLQGAPPEEIGYEEDEDYQALDGAKYPFNGARMRLTNTDFEEAMSQAERERFEMWKSERRTVEIDLYQHIKLAHLKVNVLKDKMKCLGKGLNRIREILARPDIESITDLISCGDMIRLSTKYKFRKKSVVEAYYAEDDDAPKPLDPFVRGKNVARATDNDESSQDDMPEIKTEEPNKNRVETVRHKMKAHLYKHILEDVEVLLDPKTFEVLGEATPRLKEFLSHTSMKGLVDLDIFKFDVAVDIIVDTEVVDGPVTAEQNTEPSTKAKTLTYRHSETGELVRVTAAKKMLVGEISDRLRFELNLGPEERSLVKYIQNGNLVLAEPTTDDSSKKPRKPRERKAKTKRIRLYRHVNDPGVEVVLAADSGKHVNRGRMSEALKSAINGKSVEQCVEDGEFEFIGEYDSGVPR